jgi:regulatory protein
VNDKELTRAKNAAYRFLTYRPRSRAEIEAKLHDKEFNDAIIGAVLADLERLGYVNDLQFAHDWTRSRIRLRGFGRRRIEQELNNKGIGQEMIREVFAEVFSEGTESETAKLVVEKRLNTMKALDRETRRRRLAGFLERKGFSFDIIRNVLRDADRNIRE